MSCRVLENCFFFFFCNFFCVLAWAHIYAGCYSYTVLFSIITIFILLFYSFHHISFIRCWMTNKSEEKKIISKSKEREKQLAFIYLFMLMMKTSKYNSFFLIKIQFHYHFFSSLLASIRFFFIVFLYRRAVAFGHCGFCV